MNKNYNLKLDLQFRCNNSIMTFNEFDNNTSDFFIRITNSGKLVDIEKAIVVLAVIKPSGKVASQFVEVKNGLVYADLKPNMVDEIGTYTAQAMLILEDERVVTDTISYEVKEDKIFSLLNDTVETAEDFTLLTDMLNRLSTIEISEEQRVINEAERILSEENRKIEESKRIEAELIRQHEEADRAKYDATRESNENIRKQNESTRLANETNRIDEEAKRVEEENKRKLAEEERNANYNFMTEDEERRRLEANAHKEAEKLRAQAENTRVNEEAKRRTTEQARVSAENTRVSNENTRKANEATRQNNETKRVETETQRQNRYNSFIADAEANASNFENYTNSAKIKEEERKSNELNRKSQEDRRVSNEVERISNENTRKANEAVREKNETSRQYVFENKVDEVDKKIVEINTTKDNFVSNISTKVDTKISEIDNVKDNFVSSVNTKVDSKISELDTAKSDMTNTVSNKVNEVEARFNALTSKQQQDAEVIDARDGETSLKARLDRDIEKAKQVYVNVEGSSISTDSSVGYLKDIEILGNTIQNASNLADIKSVGDKVEGQELYEIPVLSYGKNLFNGCVEKGWVDSFGNLMDSNRSRTNLIKVNPNTKYILSSSNRYQFRVVFYTVNNVYISETVNMCDTRGMIFTTPTNCKYVRFMYAETVENSTSWKIQLEEGTQATPYEPYQEDKLTILSPVKIEKVGDVADRLIEKDGVWGVEKRIIDIIPPFIYNTTYSGFSIYRHITELDIDVSDTKLANFISNQRAVSYVGRFDNMLEGDIYISPTKHIYIMTQLSQEEFASKYANKVLIKAVLNTPQFIPLPHSQQVKLRTFANKTNISFGCEIEGTIKAQVPKSLGATVNTHTEQINNLNKELDRVKKLEESTVSTVTTESDFTTVEATSNGYFEDVKLEGKTLVNLVNYNKTLEATVWNHFVKTSDLNYMLKPNTEYTIVAYVQGLSDNKTFSLQSTVTYGLFNPTNIVIDGNGMWVLKVTTKADFTNMTDVIFTTHNPNLNVGTYTLSLCLLEGDHTQNPPNGYIEGLKSVGQGVDEVSVESVKNLLDYTKLVNKVTDGTTGVITINNNRLSLDVKDRVEISSPQIYVKCRDAFVAVIGFVEKDGVPVYDSGYLPLNTISNLSLPSGVKYITINSKIGNETPVSKEVLKNVFIYHQSDKKRLLYYNEETQTWEKPILREWDSIEKHANGKYYYHVRSKEGDYVEGDESLNDCITDLTVSVKKLAEEKVYECTNIDLITYANETNYIVECGAISPKTTLKVHNNISNVVSLLQKKVSLLESDVTSYMITQNRLMLASRYNADNVTFKVDYPSMMSEREVEIDYDLFKLIQDNIIVGPENYDVDKMLEIMDLYAMIGFITWEMWDYLYEVIDSQINPVIGDLEGAPEI